MNRLFYALLSFCLTPFMTNAQVAETIYLEDFSTVEAGIGFPDPDPLVTSIPIGQGIAYKGTATFHPSFGRFSVNGTDNRLETNSVDDGELVWETDLIDISCYGDIKLDIQFIAGDNLNATTSGSDDIDYVAVDITIFNDEGEETFTDLFTAVGPYGTITYTSSQALLNFCSAMTTYTQIQVAVRFFSDKVFEGHSLNYVRVTGVSATPTDLNYAVNCDSGIQLQLDAVSVCDAEFFVEGIGMMGYVNSGSIVSGFTAGNVYTVHVRDKKFIDCVETLELLVTDCNVVLPIELVRFEGYPQEDKILLEWETATELNNDFMAVEHSTEGVSFREIGKVKGAGTSSVPRNYHFLDRQAQPGTNYYRLRQMDFDGTATYHDVIAVELTERPAAPSPIKLYPTAASVQIRVELGFKAQRELPYIIYSSLGQVVRTGRVTPETEALDISVQDLPSGTYIFSVADKDITYTSRFFKTQ
ncbi:T9SS type A sorting domain-containing protein [Flavilitoribacter nigricans]|uniref:Secretion system C-terminal sorting domain-containing protein n=1 Tax=Flavilitoribacter nigricans (strain ATCC 23147 / DSM 23189 / NBRC 102662 / NCIMB 1420 / SS-2) TaxID=1122177 RepID=A0A2D0N7Y2_FLAN2|nr:T9SS type A sorting domain-containing protein [Flavilitoribacter nigricans]PHN04508.1 hypothetical protein CRP01_21115 [Flavilitoribacter nigricans DSM 23189 = NBRC 102662]